MTLQLTIYSLLLGVLLLLNALQRIEVLPGGGRRRNTFAPADGDRLSAMLRDAIPAYVVFTPWALLLYLSGKPDLHTQYLAWIVIALEVVRGLASLLERKAWSRLLGVLSVGVLIFLWAEQLPVFQAIPR